MLDQILDLPFYFVCAQLRLKIYSGLQRVLRVDDRNGNLTGNLTVTGCIILFLGVFNLGGVVNFISHPVLVGFISAASIVIPFGLLERVFGISGLPSAFIPKMIELLKRIPSETKTLDAVLGFVTLGTLLALKHAKIRNWLHKIRPNVG